MKNILFITFSLLFYFSSIAQSNVVKVEYIASLDNKELIERIQNSSLFTPETKKTRIRHELAKEPVRFKLIFNESEGIFKMDLKETNKIIGDFNPTESASRGQRVYYSNTITKQKFWISDLVTPGAFIHLEKINWELTSETKKIGNYICFKATAVMPEEQPSGNEYLEPVVAWYTKEIPTSFGILKFHGLPGLTMELAFNRKHNGRVTFLVEKIDLNPKEDIVIKKPKGTREMKEKEYVALINRLQAERVMRQVENY